MEKHYKGLSDNEVKSSREKFGANVLTPPPSVSLWKLFLEKFGDPAIKILLVAAVLSLIISFIENEYTETIGIIVAILLSTCIAFWFERDANKKFKLLNVVNDSTAVKTVRNGEITEIAKLDLVVGDIIYLETGDEIPADAKLLESMSLQVNESTLTGELIAKKTTVEADFDANATYPSNCIYRGTNIISGHCVAEIFAVGDETEFGKVAYKATEITNDKTPLTKQLERLARFISITSFIIAGIIFAELFIKDIANGVISFENLSLQTFEHLLRYFMIAVTLIVVAVPEGLPMSVTLCLAMSMRRMLKTGNLIRKMHACETMGAVTVICTDKTGTLTQNQMQIYGTNFPAFIHFNDDEIASLIKESIAVNSTAHLDFSASKIKTLGNPTESALILWLNEQNISYLDIREKANVIDQIPFSTERKYMATMVDSPLLKRRIAYLKGAPEILLKLSDKIYTPDGIENLNAGHLEKINAHLVDYQRQAKRTLGFAYIETSDNQLTPESLNHLIFIGYVAISDPIRPEVPQAVAECHGAGIDVKIVTGDTKETAKQIAKEIGVWTEADSDDAIITGEDWGKLPLSESMQCAKKLKVMCRARPNDKQRLVETLKQGNEVVAVTGDGTNDAPALNYADVGLAMGSGTSVAKEAGDITLLNDSFSSIATAVMWGRSLYRNIQRFILFQLTINLSAMLVVLIGSMVGSELPLTVTQMLWVNLIIDTFAAAALASLPPNPNVMEERPRNSKDFIISRPMGLRIIGVGILITIIELGLLYWFMRDGSIDIRELSIFFSTFVMLQFWNMFNAKAFASKHSAFYQISKCKGFLAVMCIIPIGQLLIVQFGGEVFRTVPLSFYDWCVIIVATSPIMWVGELIRLLRKK